MDNETDIIFNLCKSHALRAHEWGSAPPCPDRRGYWKKRVRCTLIINGTHEPCVPTLDAKSFQTQNDNGRAFATSHNYSTDFAAGQSADLR